MIEMGYSSLGEVLEAAAASGVSVVSVRFALNEGRVTTVEYRNTFDLSHNDEVEVGQTDELTVITALLRQYGKAKGKGRVPYTMTFTVGGGVPTWASARLVAWLEKRGAQRDTVPAELVEQLDVGTERVLAETVAGDGRRKELEALKVEDVRKLAASLKVEGAWRTRKADLIDKIVEAERSVAAAS